MVSACLESKDLKNRKVKNKQLRVLAIDPSTDVLDLIKLSLEATTHWQLLLSSSAQEGSIKARRELPDLILLDFQMPQMNGIEMAMKLQSHPKTERIPLLLLTSLPHIISSQIFQELGIAGVVRKPLNWFSLADLIVSSLEYSKKESYSY